MAHNFFLSHFSSDKDVAEVIATVLSRISLRQLVPWFSSDNSESGGLKPGNIWFNEILVKISQSKALVTVLTPNSIHRPWIYFESGIAQALEKCEVIPVCVGVKRDTILPPLGMYQCYQLTDYKSLKEFVGKLLNKFEINFDEEMSKPVLEKALSELSKVVFTEDGSKSQPVDINQALLDIKTHFDKRFIDLLDQQTITNKQDSKPKNQKDLEDAEALFYSITINVKFPEYQGKQFLEIRADDSIQAVLNNLYLLLSDYVEPYTYMEKWILQNPHTGERMIVREVGRMVPAKVIFKQNIEWEAIKIKQEYKASSSKEIVQKN